MVMGESCKVLTCPGNFETSAEMFVFLFIESIEVCSLNNLNGQWLNGVKAVYCSVIKRPKYESIKK